MGCASGKEEDQHLDEKNKPEGGDTLIINEAKKQRRKLSIGPDQVGDITRAAATSPAVEPDVGDIVEAKAKGVLTCVFKTRKGVVPYNKNKVNQDRAIVKLNLANDPSLSLFSVCDGHGEFGHDVATFVQTQLPIFLSEEKDLKVNPSACITNACARMCAKLKEDGLINIAFSGSTCVFGLKIDQKLYVANIGDSRCIICRQTKDGYKAIPLSFDQKPENPLEKARILKAGGRVHTLPGPPGEDCGPMRVWLKDVDIPGLAMSRSVGDEVSQGVGVTSIPEIIEHTIENEDIFAVWASDGVWEFISTEKAADIIWPLKKDYNKAATALVEASYQAWRRHEEVVDDITCVIVGLNPFRE